MSIIITIVIGFIVGLLARALMPGKDPAGIVLTTLLGVGGAFVGKSIGQTLGMYHEGEPAGFFMSLIGAMVLLLIYNIALKRTTTPK